MIRSMSAGSRNNHTPLNINNLFDRYAKPKFATLGRNTGPASSSNIPNIFLMVAVLTFSISFAYSINKTQTSTNTRASGIQTTNFAKLSMATAAFNQAHTRTTYPTKYNNESIPSSIFTEGEQKYSDVSDKNLVKKYLIQTVAKYYIYSDILQQKSLITPNSQPVTLALVEEKVPELEKLVRKNAISNIDFVYIKAWQDFEKHDTKNTIQSKFGPQAKEKAIEKLNEYKSKLESGENIDTVLEQANNDADLAILNNNENNRKILEYIRDDNFVRNKQNLKIQDNNFNNFLFEQSEGKVSEVYEIGDTNKKVMAIIVYPLRKADQDFASINELIQSKLTLLQ